MKLKVLVLGSGGREDALCWKISQSNFLDELYCVPGNPGTSRWAKNISISIDDFQGIKKFCEENKIDFVIVGPENPLVNGIVDFLLGSNIKVFGPSKSSSLIEGSKSFAKDLMIRKNIPTAKFNVFSVDEYSELKALLKKSQYPVVIKADGLAAGKGVTICENQNSALKILDEIFVQKKFGEAGSKIVIEEFLEGEEFSVFAITDGFTYKILTPAQDYKRIGDGDTGKNTGGMGSYSFSELLSENQIQEIKSKIIEPVLEGLREKGTPYQGCLYCGLMQTKDGIKVIEFNCRFGDPETQSVLTTIKSDFLELLWKAVNNDLTDYDLELRGKAVCLVLASKGYPDEFEKGYEINGLEQVENSEGLMVFHAGTKFENGKIITNGGRVLNLVAFSEELPFSDLIKKVYDAAELISFENKYFRKDIGLRGLNKFKV